MFIDKFCVLVLTGISFFFLARSHVMCSVFISMCFVQVFMGMFCVLAFMIMCCALCSGVNRHLV